MRAWLLRITRQIGSWVVRVAGPHLDEYVKKLDARMVSAGDPEDVHGVELLGIQAISAVVFPIVWGFILASIAWFDFLFDGPQQVLVFIALILLGAAFPCIKVNDNVVARQRSIGLALPDFVDLLTVCVEAGLDFMGALRVVVSKQKEGPLKAELERFQKQLGLGKTRSEGLRELAVRIDSPDVWTIASALMQADRLGSPIGEALRSQSEILRVRRGQKAEKAAMEASVKVLAPLVLCILPAAFIMILGPVIIQIVSSAK